MYPSHATCGEGQLTGTGAVQHVLNGMHLSERYIHQHQLFPGYDWPGQILVHTTETSRTYQSALALIHGFVPDFDISKLNMNMSPLVNFCEDHVFGPACQCPGLDIARIKAEGECKMNSDVKKNNTEYKHIIDYVSKVLNISPNSIPGPTSLMDGLSAHTCHSMPYPCSDKGMCITSKVMENLWRVIDSKSSCMSENPSYIKFCRVSMHGLLYRIARNFKAAAENGTNAKFHVYSGHDTTVSPLIVSLGMSDNVWPGFAHRIVFELYKTVVAGKRQEFIRVLQNGRVVTDEVVFCRGKVIDNGLCSFSHFLQYLRTKDLRAFCDSLKSNVKSDRSMGF